MTWVTTTLSFRSAVLFNVSSLAGRAVRVRADGGPVWCDGRILGVVRRPAECRLPGGLPPRPAPVGPAWLRRVLDRRAPRDVVHWAPVDPVGAPFAVLHVVGAVDDCAATSAQIERIFRTRSREVVRGEVAHDGGRLGLELPSWPIAREVAVVAVAGYVRRRGGLRPVRVEEVELSLETLAVGLDGEYRRFWRTFQVARPDDGMSVGFVGAGVGLRVVATVERPRGFRPRVALWIKLRHRQPEGSGGPCGRR